MRILHVNPFYFPYYGGTEKYLYELCKRLSKKHSVSVVTSKIGDTKKVEEIDGARVYRVKSIVLEKLPSFLPPPLSIPLSFRKDLLKICENEKPEIINLHNRFFLGFSSMAFWKSALGAPLFLTLHNARTMGINKETDLFGQFFDDNIGKMIMNRADRIIANSRWTMDVTLPADYPRNRVDVIYNGVDTEKFKKVKSDIKDGLGCEFLSTTVCRLIPQKGVRYLIEAMRKIEGDFKAIIIGRGPNLDELRGMVKKFNLEKKVEFVTSFITDGELIRYYSASDFSILPSLWEPFGITLIEAMACGNPIIATEVGGIPEVVTSDCGFVVKPQSPQEIAAAANYLIEDGNLRKKMARNARERVEKVFDFDVISKKIELSYSSFLSGRN